MYGINKMVDKIGHDGHIIKCSGCGDQFEIRTTLRTPDNAIFRLQSHYEIVCLKCNVSNTVRQNSIVEVDDDDSLKITNLGDRKIEIEG